MKLCILAAALMIATPSSGEHPQISMRFSESPDAIRLVFEGAEEEFLNETKTYQSYSLLKVEFPSEFTFSSMKKPDRVSISQRGKSLFVTVAGLKNIKVFTLKDPPRLVIDADVEKAGFIAEKPVREEVTEAPELSGLNLVVDPGHGGYDIGMVGSDYKEKDIVLSLAHAIRQQAVRAGSSVFLTRNSDRYVSLKDRMSEAYARKPRFFVSLHLSSSPDIVIYYAKMDALSSLEMQYELHYQQHKHLKRSEEFARTVGEVFKLKLKRSVKIIPMPLPLLSAVDAPAIAVELPDGKYFEYSEADRALIASVVLKGITDYAKK